MSFYSPNTQDSSPRILCSNSLGRFSFQKSYSTPPTSVIAWGFIPLLPARYLGGKNSSLHHGEIFLVQHFVHVRKIPPVIKEEEELNGAYEVVWGGCLCKNQERYPKWVSWAERTPSTPVMAILPVLSQLLHRDHLHKEGFVEFLAKLLLHCVGCVPRQEAEGDGAGLEQRLGFLGSSELGTGTSYTSTEEGSSKSRFRALRKLSEAS